MIMKTIVTIIVLFQTIGKLPEKKTNYQIMSRFSDFSKPFQGRVARAVSLCLYNKIHMAQLDLPKTTDITRHSTSQLEDYHHSTSMRLLKPTYRKSADVYKIDEHEQISKLLETSSSLTKDIERVYDGLISLDENYLDKMIETDLISSNC